MSLGTLSEDGFLGGKLRLRQPSTGFRAGTDAVFLAAAVPARAGEHVLDLGCGAGAALLCLAARVPDLDLTGIEIQPAYAALARENAALNAFKAEVLDGDLNAPPPALRRLRVDHVLTNPPFFERGQSVALKDGGRDKAHRSAPSTLETFIDQGLRRLRPGGTLTIIHRTECLAGILTALAPRAGGVRILPLVARSGRSAKRLIVQARMGARAPLELLSPLVVHSDNAHHADAADYSAMARAVLQDGAGLAPLAAPR
ncbi:MAG: methyltransferase [Pseudomonadota bacterium]